jgi:hypothetical protein
MSSEKLTSICEITQRHIRRVPLSSERNSSLQESWRLSPVSLTSLFFFFSELCTQLQGKTNFTNLNLLYILRCLVFSENKRK